MTQPNGRAPLLEVRDLHVGFKTPEREWTALTGVNLQIGTGEVVGLVGETGCGKTLTGLSILGLLPRTAKVTGGDITLAGASLPANNDAAMRKLRGTAMAMVFQNPTSAFNPVHTIGRQMALVLDAHVKLDHKERDERIRASLASVGMPDVARVMRSYPHQLSGGMQQRAMIAMALLLEPKLLIADEPTTALDVTIAAQVLELMSKLQDEHGFSVLYITHDLGVVRRICDRVVVLYAGRDVETAPTKELFARPTHPYTRALLAAVPRARARGQALPIIPGTVPSNPGAMSGCPFADRCELVIERCRTDNPASDEIAAAHLVACHRARETYAAQTASAA